MAEDGSSAARKQAKKRPRLGNYEILGKLGRGAMGTVYRARQVSMDREVALKVLAKKWAADAGYVRRFLQEAQIAATLTHPNLITIIDCGQHGEVYFFSMELVPGRTLSQVLNERGPLEEGQGLTYFLEVAAALQAAHDKGIVHRDVKPANIMLDAAGRTKLGDLGLARPTEAQAEQVRQQDAVAVTEDAEGTRSGDVMGTPAYMSPEQCRGETADQRSDLYSLGATFFHLFTGERVFPGTVAQEVMQQHVDVPAPRLRQRRADLSEGLEAIFTRLLEKDPAKRYQTAQQLQQDLRRLQAGEPAEPVGGSSRPGNRSPVSRRPSGQNSPTALIAVVLALLAGGAGYWFVLGPGAGTSSGTADQTIGGDSGSSAEDADGGPAAAGSVDSAMAPPQLLAAAAGIEDRPAEWAANRALLQEAVTASAGSGFAKEARSLQEQYEARWRTAAEAAFAEADRQAKRAMDVGDALAALTAYEAIDAAFEPALQDRLPAAEQAVASGLIDEARARLGQAEAALADGALEQAVEHVAAVEAVAVEPVQAAVAAEVAALRGKLEEATAAQQAERQRAWKAVAWPVLDRFCRDGAAAARKAMQSVDAATVPEAALTRLRGALLQLGNAAERAAAVAGALQGVSIDLVVAGRERQATIVDADARALRLQLDGTAADGTPIQATVALPWDEVDPALRRRWEAAWQGSGSAADLARVLVAVRLGAVEDVRQAQAALPHAELWQDVLVDLAQRQQGKQPDAQAAVSEAAVERLASAAWRQLQGQQRDGVTGEELLAQARAFRALYQGTAYLRRHSQALADLEAAARQTGELRPGEPIADKLLVGWSFDGKPGKAPESDLGEGLTGRGMELAAGEGVRGAGLRFGGESWIEVFKNEILRPRHRNMAIACWLRTEQRDGCLLFYGERQRNSYELTLADGKPRFAMYFAGSGAQDPAIVVGETTVADGEWHHLALVRLSPVMFALFVDGELEGHGTSTDDPATVDAVESLWIGSGRVGQHGFVGELDELQLYHQALTRAEVLQLYDASTAER